MLDFELLLFHDMLSLRRREVMEDGVAGSSALDKEPGAGDFAFDDGLTGLDVGALGPAGFGTAESNCMSTGAVKSAPVFDLLVKAVSIPFLGAEDERKGETAGKVCDALMESEELFLLGAKGLSTRV